MSKKNPNLPANEIGEFDYPLKNRLAAIKVMNDAEDQHHASELKAASEARENSDGE